MLDRNFFEMRQENALPGRVCQLFIMDVANTGEGGCLLGIVEEYIV